MQYRTDIQVLRGIAVLAVLLFHLFPQYAPSGYLGVDVFFVISGYLMAALYKADSTKPGFAWEFYRRRLKRLVPAYLVVLLAVVGISCFVLLPHDYESTLWQAASGLVFAPNIYFWSGESYFNDIAFRPLLHFWSLGLEMQFYLFVPLLLIVATRAKLVLPLVILISLAACYWAINVSAKSAFFLLPFRVWEFVLGFSVPFFLNGTVGSYRIKIVASSSAILVLLLLPFLSTDTSQHPGNAALLSCFLTLVILVFGTHVGFERYRLYKSLVALGKYSYSLYLVHFPIILLVYYEPFSGEKHAEKIDFYLVLTLSLIFLFTFGLYHLVERRDWSRFIHRSVSSYFKVFVTFIVLSGLGYLYVQENTGNETKKIVGAMSDRDAWRCGKLGKLKSLVDSDDSVCQIGNQLGDEGRLLLVGDSHADSIKGVVARAANELGLSLYLNLESCALGGGSGCSVETIVKRAGNVGASTILLHNLHYNTEIEAIVDLIESAPDLNVLLIEPVPVYEQHIPRYLHEVGVEHAGNPDDSSTDSFEIKYDYVLSKLEDLKVRGLKTVNTIDYLCMPNCSVVSEDGAPYYFDNHHLTKTGADILFVPIREALAKLKLSYSLSDEDK